VNVFDIAQIHWQRLSYGRSLQGIDPTCLVGHHDPEQNQLKYSRQTLLTQRANGESSELTASIAHEINQPLTAITMYAQACIKLLRNPSVDQDRLILALEKLSLQSLRAGAIVARIQCSLRGETHRHERTHPNSLLMDLAQLVDEDDCLRDVDLQFELGSDVPAVFCDPVQVQQISLNLIHNAIDAMNQIGRINGNRVLVRSVLLEPFVWIEVVDSGTGVSRTDESHVFDAFYTTKKSGMGMGLSICRSIIAQHGGDLGFRNNVDHGATFYFCLPLAAQACDG